MLAGQLAAGDMISYLSGLLIGNEFRQAKEGGLFRLGDTIGIVRNDRLNARYHRVADIFSLTVHDGGEQATVAGALRIYEELNTNVS